MTAVHRPNRPIHGDLQVRVAARPENHRLPATLVYWSVAHHPNVAPHKVAVCREDFFEMRRAGFFLSFPDEPDVGAQRDMRGIQCVERDQLRVDSGLVIAGRPCEDALLARYILQHGSERRCLPFRGRDRLSIVVCVKDDGVGCARGGAFAEDDRRPAGCREEPCRAPALLEKADQGSCVSIQPGGICRYVGDREERLEAVQDRHRGGRYASRVRRRRDPGRGWSEAEMIAMAAILMLVGKGR